MGRIFQAISRAIVGAGCGMALAGLGCQAYNMMANGSFVEEKFAIGLTFMGMTVLLSGALLGYATIGMRR